MQKINLLFKPTSLSYYFMVALPNYIYTPPVNTILHPLATWEYNIEKKKILTPMYFW